MSYRELRNFTEIIKILGYSHDISIESFRLPNFELVADLLYWMIKMYDPESNISGRIEFESERIDFLVSVEALLASKTKIKLNTKKLYSADGRAVQELLKIATFLYSAVQLALNQSIDGINPPNIKLQDVKTIRSLASDITQSGAKLYDLLESESIDRQDRAQAIRHLETIAAAQEGSREYTITEHTLNDIIEAARQKAEDTKKECEELDADERNLRSKIDRRRAELERTEKRLQSLGDRGRPQAAEETVKLEEELAKYYEIYVAKYRNIEYLESELAAHRLREEEQRQEQAARVKKMRERLLKEELELLRSGGDLKAKDRDGVSDDDDDRKKQNSRGKGVLNRDRPRADLSDEDSLRGTQAAQRSSSPTRPIQRRVQHPIEDSDEDFGSSDDDDDDDGDDEVSDDNSDDNF